MKADQAKAWRDVEASAINAKISLRLNAFDDGMQGLQGTTGSITSFGMR